MPSMANKTNVLILVEGDRFLRVFGNPDINVKTVQVPFYASARGELLLEELIQQRLPHFWKKVYDDRLLAMHPIRDITAEDIAGRDLELAVLRTLNRIEGKI
jgi:hypothetical protein